MSEASVFLSSLVERAKAASEVPVSNWLLKFLHKRTRCVGMTREEWEKEFRFALALRRLRPLIANASPKILSEIIGPDKDSIVRQFAAGGATLAVSYHGGFPAVRIALFKHLFPDSVPMMGRAAVRDAAAALFAAREALLKGNHVLIAPDGPFGTKGTISVFGARHKVSDGAPFLAHVTGCNVAWFEAIRTKEDGFAVEIVPGPRAQRGEPYPEYRARFFRFYQERIQAALSGDPRSIALHPSWSNSFENMRARRTKLSHPRLDRLKPNPEPALQEHRSQSTYPVSTLVDRK
jgi:hypothetical protein